MYISKWFYILKFQKIVKLTRAAVVVPIFKCTTFLLWHMHSYTLQSFLLLLLLGMGLRYKQLLQLRMDLCWVNF
jgi:hypothetical protein